MSITNYLNAQEKGEQLNDTLMHIVTAAYVSIGNSLMTPEGVVEYEKLKDKDTRKSVSVVAYEALKKFAVEHYGAATTDEDRVDGLVFGLFGINLQAIEKYFEEAEEKVDINGFLSYTQRQTPFGYFLNQNKVEKPKSKLGIEDALEVVTHTKTDGRVDANKLSVDHMAELLGKFKEDGMIVDSFLKGKDYAIKK